MYKECIVITPHREYEPIEFLERNSIYNLNYERKGAIHPSKGSRVHMREMYVKLKGCCWPISSLENIKGCVR